MKKGEISHSNIKEVDDLGRAMTMMESTIGQFLSLIKSLASEQDFDKLLELITRETMTVSGAEAAFIYIVAENSNELEPKTLEGGRIKGIDRKMLQTLPIFVLGGDTPLAKILAEGKGQIFSSAINWWL